MRAPYASSRIDPPSQTRIIILGTSVVLLNESKGAAAAGQSYISNEDAPLSLNFITSELLTIEVLKWIKLRNVNWNSVFLCTYL